MTAIKGPPKCMQQLDFHPSLVFVYSELCSASWRGTQNLLLILRCSVCAGFADIPFFVDISSFFFCKDVPVCRFVVEGLVTTFVRFVFPGSVYWLWRKFRKQTRAC